MSKRNESLRDESPRAFLSTKLLGFLKILTMKEPVLARVAMTT